MGGISPLGSAYQGSVLSSLPPLDPNEIEFYIDSPTKKKPREQCRSEKRKVGCFTYNLLVFPAGNQSSFTSTGKLAVYVEAVDVERKDPRWVYSSVKFSVCVLNFKDIRQSLYHEDTHSFCASALDRGWPDLLSHAEMTRENGWLDEHGRLCVRATVCVRQADTIVMGADYDTRKETGYIGLKNHGATCYLNGLLQSYFHIGRFREIVYQMSGGMAHGEESPTGGTRMSLPLALQSVFLRLESAEQAVNTMELTRAFGWDSMDAFTQHDVQELARILCDKLEEKLKGTSGDRAIQDLFQGEVENYIECIDIDYKSRKKEFFYDVPVNVRGLSGDPLESLEKALEEFTAVEIMEGDNAYDAEDKGKQRARKGIRFLGFPPVLSFQLKRFSFDYEKLDNVKLNDRFSFPTCLHLPGNSGCLYDLHTVLVHSGDVHSGHYYAFIRPLGIKGGWFRFDDEQVSPCSEFSAVEDNFGGQDVFPSNKFSYPHKAPTVRPRIHSAYMLVYIRREMEESILMNPTSVIAEVEDRVQAEARKIDQRKKLNEEAKQTAHLFVHTTTDFLGKSGFGSLLELTPQDSTRHLSVKKDVKVSDLSQIIAQRFFSSPITARNTALFYAYSSSSRNVPRWTLMSPVYVGGSMGSTPKSSRLENKRIFPSENPDTQSESVERRVSDFMLDAETHILAVASDSDALSSWTDSTPFVLVHLKFFDVASKRLETIGFHHFHIDDQIGSIIPLFAQHVSPMSRSREIENWLAFEELLHFGKEMRIVELLSSFGGERISNGSILVLQRNTITDAETEESSEDDMAVVPSLTPPKFPTRTVSDYALSLTSSVKAELFIHSTSDRISTDGILANGVLEASASSTLVAPEEEKSIAAVIAMDSRWNLRVVVAEIIKILSLTIDNKSQRLEVYERNPLSVRDAPIATSDDLLRIGRVAKIGTCKHLVPNIDNGDPHHAFTWKLHAIVVPKNAICIRIFDLSVRETSNFLVSLSDFPDPKHVTVSKLAAIGAKRATLPPSPNKRFALVEFYKSQISKLHKTDDSVDLEQVLINTTNFTSEYLRLEPDQPENITGKVTCFVSHVDKASGISFGYPFVLHVDGNSARRAKISIQEKLCVSDKIWNKWRLCMESHSHGSKYVHLKDDDNVQALSADGPIRLVLEHNHPCPELLGLHRATTPSAIYKPLTIR